MPSIKHIAQKYADQDPIVAMTAYDVFTASLLEELAFDFVLVGDSLGMVVLGYDSTLPVTVDEMIHHASAVVRGAPTRLVVVDMPFMSYQESTEQAVRNAGRILKETRAQAIKVEGGQEIASTVNRLVEIGIPVMGHIGLQPQSVHSLGGYCVQAKQKEQQTQLCQDAQKLQASGCFAVVLECVPASVACDVTQSISIPTIGIGAGGGCSGQILVTSDALGMNDTGVSKFVKVYSHLKQQARDALSQYRQEVVEGAFPSPEQSY